MSENVREKYKNNKLKLTVSMWNDESELHGGFYLEPDIQNDVEYIIKGYKTLPTNPPIHIYISIGYIISIG